jgi:uncharacterized protein YjbJ (UPF0337 family)
MNRDQVKGTAKKIEGELKDQKGNATGDLSDDVEGKVEKGVGEVQKDYGDMKERIRKDRADTDPDR